MQPLYLIRSSHGLRQLWLACRDDRIAWRPGGRPIHDFIGLDPEASPDAYAACARYIEGLVTLSEATAVLQWAADGDCCEPIAVEPVALPVEPRRMLRELYDVDACRLVELQSFGLTLAVYRQSQ